MENIDPYVETTPWETAALSQIYTHLVGSQHLDRTYSHMDGCGMHMTYSLDFVRNLPSRRILPLLGCGAPFPHIPRADTHVSEPDLSGSARSSRMRATSRHPVPAAVSAQPGAKINVSLHTLSLSCASCRISECASEKIECNASSKSDRPSPRPMAVDSVSSERSATLER